MNGFRVSRHTEELFPGAIFLANSGHPGDMREVVASLDRRRSGV